MKYKTIHLVGFGFFLSDKGEFKYQDGKFTLIQTENGSFLGKVSVVNSYYHDWFDVHQLGLEHEFKKYKIETIETEDIQLLPPVKNRKMNLVIGQLNAIRTEFMKIKKKMEQEDLFDVFLLFCNFDLPVELLRMIYEFHKDIGYYKISIFV